MHRSEYRKLVDEYRTEKAEKALDWFVENHSPEFRQAVRQASYCIDNEYLWF